MTRSQPTSAAVDPLVGRVLDGRYRVEAFIARGGMATVYRGADLRLDRTVAIKVMHPSFATDLGFVDRFDREARAAARLNSQYAVGIHDQGSDGGLTYLVMEYVPGHTVRDVLRTHGPLPPAQALAILEPVLEALAAAHRAGYVHRDIKPENVLISEDGRVKVTDFGLARAIEVVEPGRSHGLLLGTVAYLSPEQVEHDRTDARSDVYSAGILLYELVTGQVPFIASAPMQVAYKHVHEDVPTPSTVRAGIPPVIDALVRTATRRPPAQRFSDATAFLAEVRRVRATMPPVPAWSPSPHDTLVVDAGAFPRVGDGVTPSARGPGAPTPASGPAGSGGSIASPVAASAVAAGAAAGRPAVQHSGDHTEPDRAPAVAGPDDATRESPGLGAGGSPALTGDPDGHPTDVGHHTSEDAAAPRVRRGRRAIWLVGVALLAAAGLLFVLFGPFQRVAVPDVLGRTPSEAAAILATANLVLQADQQEFSEDYPSGQIMSTDPAAPGRILSGGTVTAVVSKGPERYDVPAITGLTIEEATVALNAANLELGGSTAKYHDDVKDGDIIASTPKAGTSVKPGTPVSVTVSQGPAPVEIPSLAGVPRKDAEKQLKELGLKVDRSEEYSETVAKDLVISTKPKAGATAYRGDTVDVVVSKGPPLVEVPRVVGMDESAARARLEQAGFRVQVRKPLGFVIFGVNSQSPRAGTKAPKGSTVTITVV